MSQIAPNLESSLMNMAPDRSPREKLRCKMREMRGQRASASAKEHSYQLMKEKVYEERKKEEEAKEQEKTRKKNHAKNHRRKLKELEKSVGEVTQEVYNQSMIRLKEDKYEDDGAKNRDKNLTELYCLQQKFSEKLSMEDMDEI